MIFENIEKKLRLTLWGVSLTVIGAIGVAGLALWHAQGLIRESEEKIYVLSDNFPLLAQRQPVREHRTAEYASHVKLFHMLFFTLPPDDAYISSQIERALYLIDDSGQQQYSRLKEKGFYNGILSASAMLSIRSDSVQMNEDGFTYYGTQRIERQTRVVERRLITRGRLQEVVRSENNPHGLLITHWEILENSQIDEEVKSTF